MSLNNPPSGFSSMNVIITGASKGLGKAIAEQFAMEGHTLLVCARNEVHLYAMVEELLTKYPQCRIRAKAVDLAKRNRCLHLPAGALKAEHPEYW